MKLGKKLLALLLAAVLCFSLMPTVFADVTYEAKLSSQELTVSEEDQTVTVTVKGVAAFECDGFGAQAIVPDGLELVSITNTELTSGFDANAASGLFAMNADANFTLTEICVLTYKIPANTKAGTYVLGIEELEVTKDIFATVTEGGVVTATLTIKGNNPVVPVESVSLDKTELKLAKGGNAKLTATVLPADATDKTVTWTTSKDKVAIVAADGTVTAVGEGTAVITATAGGKTAQCTVTVVNCLHSSKSFVAAKAATCTEKGMKAHYKCDTCSALFETATSTTPVAASALELPMIDHTFTDVAEKAATCTEKGNVAYKHCSTCGKNYDAEGKLLDTVETDALGHDMTFMTAVPATCNATGTKAYFHCERCTKNFVDQNGQGELTDLTTAEDPTNHAGGTELVNVKAPSHVNKEDGYTGDTKCLGCGKIIAKGETISWGTHVWSDWKHDADKHWKECTVAGCTEKNKEAPHNGGTATCQEQAKCEICGAAYGKLGEHNFDTKWTSDDTYHYHKCLTAGCTEKADDAAKHSSTGANEANCLHKAKCDVCAAEYGNLGAHTLTKTAAKAPTCLEPGNNEYYTCSVCGKVFKDAAGTTETTVAAETLAKSTTHVVESKYATSATEHWQICKVCGTVVGKAAHKFGEADANGRKTCADCGYTVGGTGTEGHKHAAGNTICYDENNHWNKCTDDNCDAHVNESAHKFGPKNTVTEGNKTITIETCSECGYVKRTETTTGGTTPVNPGGNKPTKPGTKDNGKTVQSGKTFDAGVGVYVGLSILSLTGSAVVIGKKRKTR